MIRVDDSHFAYLAVQRGKQSNLVEDRASWQSAYEASLFATLSSIRNDLPALCANVLDVGGGLGGIDVLLARRYPNLAVTILDGEDDAPIVDLHRRTFNNMEVARDFLAKNGVSSFDYFTPALGDARPFDLVCSFGSWCFHYEPSVYLDFVQRCCRPGTVLILEVRRNRPAWRAELTKAFALQRVAFDSPKYQRLVFRA